MENWKNKKKSCLKTAETNQSCSLVGEDVVAAVDVEGKTEVRSIKGTLNVKSALFVEEDCGTRHVRRRKRSFSSCSGDEQWKTYVVISESSDDSLVDVFPLASGHFDVKQTKSPLLTISHRTKSYSPDRTSENKAGSYCCRAASNNDMTASVDISDGKAASNGIMGAGCSGASCTKVSNYKKASEDTSNDLTDSNKPIVLAARKLAVMVIAVKTVIQLGLVPRLAVMGTAMVLVIIRGNH